METPVQGKGVCQASAESISQFLQAQVAYATTHLQIADAKAAGVIAFMSVLCGYTASRLDVTGGRPCGVAAWMGLIGGAIGVLGIAAACWAIMPRGWGGRDPSDTFSWVGLSRTASSSPYTERVNELTTQQMHRALADVAETSALIVRRKYQLVAAAILASIVAVLLQVGSWMLV